jgi:neural cell adhesion molecule
MSSTSELEELSLGKSSVGASTGLLVNCLESYDGGLPIQSYHVEVVADEDESRIILNKTVLATTSGPSIEVAGLSTGRSYRLFLYAANAKGRSEAAILEPVTLKGVAMYTTGELDFIPVGPFSTSYPPPPSLPRPEPRHKS